MKLQLDNTLGVPLFQQIVDQIHFAISAGELKPGDRLPSIRSLAAEQGIAVNTVAKALRQLEFRGLIESRERSGYTVSAGDAGGRYRARGVSSDKAEVHSAVDRLDEGLFPGAFCKITEDYLTGDPRLCNVIHSDGSGTKSIIAYLKYKESGDAGVFHGIAQDSIVMNLDDLVCVGLGGRILISNTVNRNALNCPGDVISALIEGSEQFLAELRQWGVNIYSGGGETADVGDLTGSVVVDTCAVSVMRKEDVITTEGIAPGLAIVGLSSTGQTSYERSSNSGIGSNGLTSARHDLLHSMYGARYPESFDANLSKDLVYCGPYRLEDPLPGSNLSVGDALLSPTRTYAPVIYRILETHREVVRGIVHCSGGGQTKCLRFGHGTHFIKDALFPAPPIFTAIQAASNTSWREMYQVFNMGHRMELFCEEQYVEELIAIAASFDLEARQIGHTAPSDRPRLSIIHEGEALEY